MMRQAHDLLTVQAPRPDLYGIGEPVARWVRAQAMEAGLLTCSAGTRPPPC